MEDSLKSSRILVPVYAFVGSLHWWASAAVTDGGFEWSEWFENLVFVLSICSFFFIRKHTDRLGLHGFLSGVPLLLMLFVSAAMYHFQVTGNVIFDGLTIALLVTMICTLVAERKTVSLASEPT